MNQKRKKEWEKKTKTEQPEAVHSVSYRNIHVIGDLEGGVLRKRKLASWCFPEKGMWFKNGHK